LFGRTRNAWERRPQQRRLERRRGGGGRERIAPLAVATDGGGSPASRRCNGVVG